MSESKLFKALFCSYLDIFQEGREGGYLIPNKFLDFFLASGETKISIFHQSFSIVYLSNQ